jgi:hypothetical protein
MLFIYHSINSMPKLKRLLKVYKLQLLIWWAKKGRNEGILFMITMDLLARSLLQCSNESLMPIIKYPFLFHNRTILHFFYKPKSSYSTHVCTGIISLKNSIHDAVKQLYSNIIYTLCWYHITPMAFSLLIKKPKSILSVWS